MEWGKVGNFGELFDLKEKLKMCVRIGGILQRSRLVDSTL